MLVSTYTRDCTDMCDPNDIPMTLMRDAYGVHMASTFYATIGG